MLIPPLLFVPIVYFLHISFNAIITSSLVPYFWLVWIVVFCLEGFDQRNGKRAVITGFTMLVEFTVIGAMLYFIGIVIPFGTLLAGNPSIERVVSIIGTSITLSGLSPLAGISVFGQISYAYIGVIIGTYIIAGYLSGTVSRMRKKQQYQQPVNSTPEQVSVQPSKQPSYIG